MFSSIFTKIDKSPAQWAGWITDSNGRYPRVSSGYAEDSEPCPYCCYVTQEYPSDDAVDANDHFQIFWMTEDQYSLCLRQCQNGNSEGASFIEALLVREFLECAWDFWIEGFPGEEHRFDDPMTSPT